MQRIGTLFCNQLMSFHTHQHIRRLDTHYQVVISHIFNHMHFIKRTFNNSFCRHTTVFFEKMLFQRTAVYAHPNRNSIFFRLIHHGLHLVFRSNIARIDPDLVRPVFNRCNGKSVVKVNIRHQWDMDLLFYLFQSFCRLTGGHSATDDLTSCGFQPQYLFHSSRHIFRLCIRHGLDRNRIGAADLNISDPDLFCLFS